MQFAKEVKKNSFREWYYNQPYVKVGATRKAIIAACGINGRIFYAWLQEKTPVPEPAKVIINQVTGQRVFDIEDPKTVDEIFIQEQCNQK